MVFIAHLEYERSVSSENGRREQAATSGACDTDKSYTDSYYVDTANRQHELLEACIILHGMDYPDQLSTAAFLADCCQRPKQHSEAEPLTETLIKAISESIFKRECNIRKLRSRCEAHPDSFMWRHGQPYVVHCTIDP
jgi:hypothetical protein